ncbi:bifunctional DNA primase/polymerase [Streptomyces lavendulocolor]|uniref:bifunctional DNA primase/polymerase n=1 Tax=Streptomyces lavendulocolor TaxID=67316 RepID=UPI0033D9F210
MPVELRFHSSDSDTLAPSSSVAGALLLARWCATRGWPVHPLSPQRKTPVANCSACRAPGHTYRGCRCRAEGRWCHGFHAATLDMALITQWWSQNPHLGVGVACGPAGLVVIDIDAHPQGLPSRDRILPGIPIDDSVDLSGMTTGFHSIAVLAALRGEESPADDVTTLRVKTPSGGLHVWYRTTDSRRWQCSTGSSNGRALAWQVDVRAHGGYIVAPGTTTKAGTYMPIGSAREPAALPAWLALELERTGHLPAVDVPAPRPVPPRARQAVIEAGGGVDHAHRILTVALAEITACGVVTEGAGFSSKLNRASFTAGGLVAAGHFSHEAVERALLEAAAFARPGQEPRAAQIIRSGMRAGFRRPLSVGGQA